MGSGARYDALKLVLPGRCVEIHTKPITAAEVLKNYPRHSVTRPDVFEYPWIVVKPEAVLNPGKVFFIVPNYTIYKLLKAHKKQHQHSPSQNQSPKNTVDKQEAQNQDSPREINAGSTPKHLNRHQKLNLSPPTTSCMWIPFLNQDRDLKTRKRNKVGSWPEVMSKNKSTLLRLEEKPVKDSRSEVRSSNHEEYHTVNKSTILRVEENLVKDSRIKVRSSAHKEYHTIDSDITAEFPEMDDDDDYYDVEFKPSREVATLKSCLRKSDSVRKSLQLKVTFLLPSKYKVQQRRGKVSGDEFAGNYPCSFADFLVHSARIIPT
ncbi:conserved hypothetical protein [Ricinus communis]|uniref:Uncharacterized protein n=1 Tax=Ricinus communis TaxID=3988 RepID=B9S528_RICCO|nr:conserved hypothetical protein [Ricinus communis]